MAGAAVAEAIPSLIEAGLSGGENSVFWSGGDVAHMAAKEYGMTLSKTVIGGAMDKLETYELYTFSKSTWNWASGVFARNASGNAIAVIRGGLNPSSTWVTIEEPILNARGIPIVYR